MIVTKKTTTICFILILSVFYLTGCATIVKGPYQDIRVTSNPNSIWINADPGGCGRTPCTLPLKRSKSITLIAKYDGETQQVTLSRGVEGWFFGNIIFGGVIGAAVDLGSGSFFKLHPNHVHFDFKYVIYDRQQRRAEYLNSTPDIDENILRHIKSGTVVEGMTREQIIATMGTPTRVTENINGIFLIYYRNNKEISYMLKDNVYIRPKVKIHKEKNPLLSARPNLQKL